MSRQLKIVLIKAVLDSLKNKKINWYLLVGRNMFIWLRRDVIIIRECPCVAFSTNRLQ
jgi:hypothetical protein